MFTTHILIGMLLKPNVFIKQNQKILDNQKTVEIDFLQFLSDNSSESLLSPEIKPADIELALKQLSFPERGTDALSKLYLYFLKLLFLVNVTLSQYGYADVNVIPTINSVALLRLNDVVIINGIELRSWLKTTLSSDFLENFEELSNGQNLWRIDSLGSVLHSFPQALNTLEIKRVIYMIMSSDDDATRFNDLLLKIYLAEFYGLKVFPYAESEDDNNKEVIISNEKSNHYRITTNDGYSNG